MDILNRVVGYIGISCIALVCFYCFYVFSVFIAFVLMVIDVRLSHLSKDHLLLIIVLVRLNLSWTPGLTSAKYVPVTAAKQIFVSVRLTL